MPDLSGGNDEDWKALLSSRDVLVIFVQRDRSCR
jgi:hypothetical protein